MITLSKEQIKRIHIKMLETTGGSGGIKSEALLESARASSLQTFDGMELYPTVMAKIARITYSLVRNHPFVDGNKRIGTYVMLVLLELNHIEIDFSDEDIIRIGLELANGKMDYEQLLSLLLERLA